MFDSPKVQATAEFAPPIKGRVETPNEVKLKMMDEIMAILVCWPEQEVVAFVYDVQQAAHLLLLDRLADANDRAQYMTQALEQFRSIIAPSDNTAP